MDSERPAPPTHERHVTRPFYLVTAMVLLWILGVQTLLAGGETAVTLHDGALQDIDALARSGNSSGGLHEVFFPLLVAARMVKLSEIPHLAFPLSVAQALLASTLVLASTMVLVGRPSSRTFALQAIGANAVFAVIEYVALRHARGQWIDLAARAASVIQDPTIPGDAGDLTRSWGYLTERIRLVFVELGIPLLAAIALTRPRTKTYFADAAAAADGAEEEP